MINSLLDTLLLATYLTFCVVKLLDGGVRIKRNIHKHIDVACFLFCIMN